MFQSLSDGDGEVDFRLLPFSNATITVRAPGFARRLIAWQDGREELKLDLKPEAVLVGEIIHPIRPVTQTYNVSLKSETGEHISVWVQAKDRGKFRVAELPAGKWTVTLSGNRVNETKALTIHLKEGETKSCKFEWK